MTWGRGGNSRTHHQKCPECGAELLVGDPPRRLRFSAIRAASTNGHGLVATEPSDLTEHLADRIVSEQAQTLSDRDQTASDGDQTSSDRDQATSDRDEKTASDDQEVSDRELAEGGDVAAHDRNKLARDRASADRLITSQLRDGTALDRGQNAGERDQIAESRDRLAAGTDETKGPPNGPTDVALRDAFGYFRAEANRARAAGDRATAASDRERAAQDREEAAALRAAAARDRAEAVRERKLAGVDQLTGVSLRSVGLGQIEREIQRSRRTGKPLVLVFVDVNNLKAVNDNEGHIAGDVLLRGVADTLRMKLRPYDVIVRFGGDEFICVLANIDPEGVRRRFKDIIATLEMNGREEPISFGLSELEQDDDFEHLLERADGALIEARRSHAHR
jgi:diguanylate cyclase (GGDEF)-like protein